MKMQFILPFKNLQVSDKHVDWLRLANSERFWERELEKTSA